MREQLYRFWDFIWNDDSLLSWLANVILALILVKFVIYPGLGYMLSTDYPVVAVVSGSMEHNNLDFDQWWDEKNEWYIGSEITKEEFSTFPFLNGFNKGDIMVLKGVETEKIKKGEVIVYATNLNKYPIIHRMTKILVNNGTINFITKGDNNDRADIKQVNSKQVIGMAVFKIPYLGWIKIGFTDTWNALKNVWLTYINGG